VNGVGPTCPQIANMRLSDVNCTAAPGAKPAPEPSAATLKPMSSKSGRVHAPAPGKLTHVLIFPVSFVTEHDPPFGSMVNVKTFVQIAYKVMFRVNCTFAPGENAVPEPLAVKSHRTPRCTAQHRGRARPKVRFDPDDEPGERITNDDNAGAAVPANCTIGIRAGVRGGTTPTSTKAIHSRFRSGCLRVPYAPKASIATTPGATGSKLAWHGDRVVARTAAASAREK